MFGDWENWKIIFYQVVNLKMLFPIILRLKPASKETPQSIKTKIFRMKKIPQKDARADEHKWNVLIYTDCRHQFVKT